MSSAGKTATILVLAALGVVLFMPRGASAATVAFQATRYSTIDLCQVNGSLSYDNTPSVGGNILFTGWIDIDQSDPGLCPIEPTSIYLDYSGSTGAPAYDSGQWGSGHFSVPSPYYSASCQGYCSTSGSDSLQAPSAPGTHTLNVRLKFSNKIPFTGYYQSQDNTTATISFTVPPPTTVVSFLKLFFKW